MTSHTETARDRLPRFARVAGGWTGLRTAGVEVGQGGQLGLARLPDAGVPATPAVAFDPAGPGGLTLGADGFGFVSDPVRGKVIGFNDCPPTDPGSGLLWLAAVDTEFCPGRFTTPRGLALGPRERLYVADAGADAVIVLDLATGATTGSWPRITPWQVAADRDRLIVLDRGGPAATGRLAVFDADGSQDAAFTPTTLTDPIRVGVAEAGVVVLDRGAASDRVVLLDPATGAPGITWTPVRGDPAAGLPLTDVARISGLAVVGERVHLVDADRGDLLSFTLLGEFVGTAPAAELLADLQSAADALWGAPRMGGAWLRHDPVGRCLASGAFVCGPIDTATESGRRELSARLVTAPGQHVRLWAAVAPGGVVPDPSTLPRGADTSPSWVAWQAFPADVEAALVPQPTGPLVCIGGELSGDGSSSPAVDQVSIGGGGSWLDLLPAVYRKDGDRADFLDRLLRLLHSLAEETDSDRRGLPARFDAWAAPDRAGQSTLEDLAAWVATGLDERWDEARRRRAVARAHPSQALRGTPLGLSDAVEAQFGVRPSITSAAQAASVWHLGTGEAGCGCNGASTGLGFTSMLAAAPPEGAVLGAGAAVNGSYLLEGADTGTPLFADLAHRFHVELPAAAVAEGGGEAALRALIDRERPAHTAYTLCLIGPDARVAVQSRVGIDLIVGGDRPPLRLDDERELGRSALAGHRSQVGKEHIA